LRREKYKIETSKNKTQQLTREETDEHDDVGDDLFILFIPHNVEYL